MADEIRNTPESEQEEPQKIDLGASLRKERKDKKPANKKLVLILTAIVIVAVALLAVFLPKWIKPAEDEVVEDLSVALSDHVSDDVISVTVEGENTFTITSEVNGEETTYHMSLFDDDKLNQSTCSSAFSNAAKMKADQLVEANAADLSIYGLDQPSARVTVEYSDGDKLELELGAQLDLTGQVYCRKAGEQDVYILRQFYSAIYGGSIQRYRGLSLPTLNADVSYTRSIIIRQKDQEQIRFMPVDDAASYGTWKMTEPQELWLDSGYVGELVEDLSGFKLYAYEGRFDDLSAFGLDDPWFEVVVSDSEGGKRTLRLGNELEGENLYYCTVDDSGEVFTISTTYLDFATDFNVAHYLDMFTNIINITAVDELEISDGTNTWVLSIEREEQYDEDGNLKTLANGDPNYLCTYFIDGKSCQEGAFKRVYQSVIGVTISNLADQALVDEIQQSVVKLTYHLNTGEEPMVVEYLPYDINNYCVRKEGKIALICKREAVDEILPTLHSAISGEYDTTEE